MEISDLTKDAMMYGALVGGISGAIMGVYLPLKLGWRIGDNAGDKLKLGGFTGFVAKASGAYLLYKKVKRVSLPLGIISGGAVGAGAGLGLSSVYEFAKNSIEQMLR